MRKANIKEYSRRLWAANLDAAVWLEEAFDPQCDYTWADAADDWHIKFRAELEHRVTVDSLDSDSAKALLILDELENKRTTLRTWKDKTQEHFSSLHIAFLKQAMQSDSLPMLHVQRGNSKTGKIPCVNMPMYLTCPSGAACRGYCYAGKECRNKYLFRYNSENLALYLKDKAAFKAAVIVAIFNDSVIRWHEAGDIVNADYFDVMVEVAKFYPNKRFYAYTKKYNIVNDYITKKGALPSNLTLIFSADKNLKMENPYFFPVAKIDFGNGEKLKVFRALENAQSV